MPTCGPAQYVGRGEADFQFCAHTEEGHIRSFLSSFSFFFFFLSPQPVSDVPDVLSEFLNNKLFALTVIVNRI